MRHTLSYPREMCPRQLAAFAHRAAGAADSHAKLFFKAHTNLLDSRFQSGKAVGADAPEGFRPHLALVMA